MNLSGISMPGISMPGMTMPSLTMPSIGQTMPSIGQTPATDTLAETYDLTTFVNHMLFKEMWGGSSRLMELSTFVADRVPIINEDKVTGYNWAIRRENVIVSDRFMKCVDEVITNAGDHAQRTRNKPPPHKMTLLMVYFDPKTGKITAINDGDGFDVAVHPRDPAGRYIPEIITTETLRGSNFKKESGSITAGTNGVGVKLTNAHSLKFTLDTYDIGRNTQYIQNCLNHLDVIEKPTVIPNPPNKLPHTKVEFQLDYAAVGWGFLDQKDPNDKIEDKPANMRRQCYISPIILSQLEKLVRYRVCQMAVFLGAEYNVFFNDEKVPYNNLESIATAMYPGHKIFMGHTIYKSVVNIAAPVQSAPTMQTMQAMPTMPAMPSMPATPIQPQTRVINNKWEIIVVAGMDGYEQTSFINGVECKTGQHLDKIKNLIHDAAKERAKDLFPDMTKYHGQMMNLLAVLISGNIPDAQWGGGQLKTSIQMDARLFKEITIDKKFLSPICEYLYDKMLISTRNSKKPNTRVRADKYEKAEQLGKASTLILIEGTSAESMVQKGRRNPTCGMGTARFGTYIIGGVPMNVRKQVEIRYPEGYPPIILQSKQLMQNQTIQEFVAIMNLDYNKSYESDKEYNTLNYGIIWFLFDEDLDGNGCITGLYLNLIHLFWPALIRRGVIKRLRTPLVRIRAGKRIINFYDENEAKEFLAREKAANPTARYEPRYYKGLATNEDYELLDVFRNREKNLITYAYDKEADASFAMYYLKETELRKIEFKTPTRSLTEYEKVLLESHHLMECSTQLRVFTKCYKMDNLTRKLPCIVDGLVMTRRRILAGAIYKFGYEGTNKLMKVFQFGGSVAETQNYHHGDLSLYSAITNMSHRFPNGGPILPLLQGSGQIGSSLCGGQDAGSARYIEVRINRPLIKTLFPKTDMTTLNYTYEDGQKSIPKYYVPVAPLVLFRSEKIPADGWRFMIWARDVPATLHAIRKLIKSPAQATHADPSNQVTQTTQTNQSTQAGQTTQTTQTGSSTQAQTGQSQPANMSLNHIIKLPPSTVGYKGKIIEVGGDEYSIGTYIIRDVIYTGFYSERDGTDKEGRPKFKTIKVTNIHTKEIVITSLPLRIWSKFYVNSFKKVEYEKTQRGAKKKIIIDEYDDIWKDFFCDQKPFDRCNDPNTEIVFILRPDGLEKLVKSKIDMFDRIQKLFDKNDDSDKEVPIKPAETEADGEDAGADDPADTTGSEPLPPVGNQGSLQPSFQPVGNQGSLQPSFQPAQQMPTNPPIQPIQPVQPQFKMPIADPIIIFFGLMLKMTHNLNILGEDGAVKEYKKYEDILYDWFPIRKAYYLARISREMVLLNIKIRYLNEKLRFCQNYTAMGLGNKLKESEMNAVLSANKFIRVNNAIYNRPGDADERPTDALFGLIFSDDMTDNVAVADDETESKKPDYTYLLHMHTRHRSEENQIKMANEIAELTGRLNQLVAEWNADPFPGASQWLRELDAFEDIYRKGISSDWKYGEDDNVTFT